MVYRQTARSAKVREESRGRLLAATRKLIARQGYEATTMQQVVREARTSIGNAYFYFENKEELVKALVEEGLRATWAKTDPIIASVEPGPSRIAVAVYADVMSLLGPEKDLAAMAVTGMPRVVHYLSVLIWERLCGLFAENFPKRETREVLMISAAVFGTNRLVVELCLSGELNPRPEDAARFCVAWHLRALDVREGEIDRATKLAAALYKRALKPDR